MEDIERRAMNAAKGMSQALSAKTWLENDIASALKAEVPETLKLQRIGEALKRSRSR